ncbi:unnamed protein product [Periconia digitata]|uniref:Uncharacterized protein n=1 Tax=Periconia digitata TaxID=1303443 RepID=A0A9W4XJE4_9PLEO|nr:unnamed protein product [Periconia digitata]
MGVLLSSMPGLGKYLDDLDSEANLPTSLAFLGITTAVMTMDLQATTAEAKPTLPHDFTLSSSRRTVARITDHHPNDFSQSRIPQIIILLICMAIARSYDAYLHRNISFGPLTS